MSKTILLAVDAASREPGKHVAAAAAMISDLSQLTGDEVIVLHVHEFAHGKFGAVQVDCLEGEGETLTDQIVADLTAAGVSARSDVRRADYGHVARTILTAADECDARFIALGSSSRTDLPLLPFGSVSNRLLHLSHRPVLIVPLQADAAAAA